jgi:hypothetical protein
MCFVSVVQKLYVGTSIDQPDFYVSSGEECTNTMDLCIHGNHYILLYANNKYETTSTFKHPIRLFLHQLRAQADHENAELHLI